MRGITRLGFCQSYLFGLDSSYWPFMFKGAVNAAATRLLKSFCLAAGQSRTRCAQKDSVASVGARPVVDRWRRDSCSKIGRQPSRPGQSRTSSLHLSHYTSPMPAVRPRALLRASGSRYSRVRHHRKRCSDRSVSAEGRSRSGTGDPGST